MSRLPVKNRQPTTRRYDSHRCDRGGLGRARPARTPKAHTLMQRLGRKTSLATYTLRRLPLRSESVRPHGTRATQCQPAEVESGLPPDPWLAAPTAPRRSRTPSDRTFVAPRHSSPINTVGGPRLLPLARGAGRTECSDDSTGVDTARPASRRAQHSKPFLLTPRLDGGISESGVAYRLTSSGSPSGPRRGKGDQSSGRCLGHPVRTELLGLGPDRGGP